jgi:hypothetical protein
VSPFQFGGSTRQPHYIYSLRSFLPRSDWNRLRHAVYRVAGNHCERCGGTGSKGGVPPWPLEAHEIWNYQDTEKNHQRLEGLLALCPNCHAKEHRENDSHAGRIGVGHARATPVGKAERAKDGSGRVIGNYIEVDWDGLTAKYGIRLSRTGHELLQLFPVEHLRGDKSLSSVDERGIVHPHSSTPRARKP